MPTDDPDEALLRHILLLDERTLDFVAERAHEERRGFAAQVSAMIAALAGEGDLSPHLKALGVLAADRSAEVGALIRERDWLRAVVERLISVLPERTGDPDPEMTTAEEKAPAEREYGGEGPGVPEVPK